MHGAHAARTRCQCTWDQIVIKNQNHCYPQSVQEASKRANNSDQFDKCLVLAVSWMDSHRSRKLCEKKEIVMEEVSMSGYRSLFEELSFVAKSKTQKLCQLFGSKTMQVLGLGISKKLKACLFCRPQSHILADRSKVQSGRTYESNKMAILREFNKILNG